MDIDTIIKKQQRLLAGAEVVLARAQVAKTFKEQGDQGMAEHQTAQVLQELEALTFNMRLAVTELVQARALAIVNA
jgi:hypothetical protein